MVFLMQIGFGFAIIVALSEAEMKTKIRAFLCVSAVLLTAASVPAVAADYLNISGKELYKRFCASCHGAEAHGDGPVAASFNIKVPDLTLIARQHGGIFSPDLIERIVDGRQIIGAHGTREMPVWGEEFTRSEIGYPEAEQATHTIIARIAEFISTIQQPSQSRRVPLESPALPSEHRSPAE